MATVHQSAASSGTPEPDTHLTPRAAELLRKMAMVAYVLDCHRQAVAKHSAHLAELEAELAELERRT